MAEQYVNAAQTTLAASIAAGDTALTVGSTLGFPTTGNFSILIDTEILEVTAVTGTLFTVNRAAEAYAGVQLAAAHAANALVSVVLTQRALLALPFDASGAAAAAQAASDPAGSAATVAASVTALSASLGTAAFQPATAFDASGAASTAQSNAEAFTTAQGYLTANQTITLSGVVTGGGATAITTSIANGALTNAMLANSSVTVNGTSIALGGSGTVTAAAGTLTGSTLAGGVTASSLTSVGTLATLTVTATITGSVSGNAATATAASGLASATTTVAVSSATAPTTGQVLTATGASAATWQTPSGTTYSAGNGLSLTGTTFAINYGYAGTFTAVQSFSGNAFTYSLDAITLVGGSPYFTLGDTGGVAQILLSPQSGKIFFNAGSQPSYNWPFFDGNNLGNLGSLYINAFAFSLLTNTERLYVQSGYNGGPIAGFQTGDSGSCEMVYISNAPGGASGGCYYSIRLEDSTTRGVLAAKWIGYWVSSTHASYAGGTKIVVEDYNGEREGMRIESNGSASLISFLGASAVVQQANASQAAITAVTDANAKTALQAIYNLLLAYGLAPATA